MDGAEGARSVNELYQLVVTCPQPLRTERARHSRAKSQRGTVRVEVEDGGGGGGDRRGRGGGREPRGGERLGGRQRGAVIEGGGHPLNRRRERERAERNQRERRGPEPER